MEQSWPSIWLLVRSWLTPAVLFLLLNSIICIIALTSKTLRRCDDPAAAANCHVIVRTASSALHRLRSLSLPRMRSADFSFDQKSDDIAAAAPKAEAAEKEDEGESTKKGAKKEEAVVVEEEEEEEVVVDGGVDAQADDFINRFRRQLHLQRLNSLLNRGK